MSSKSAEPGRSGSWQKRQSFVAGLASVAGDLASLRCSRAAAIDEALMAQPPARSRQRQSDDAGADGQSAGSHDFCLAKFERAVNNP